MTVLQQLGDDWVIPYNAGCVLLGAYLTVINCVGVESTGGAGCSCQHFSMYMYVIQQLNKSIKKIIQCKTS